MFGKPLEMERRVRFLLPLINLSDLLGPLRVSTLKCHHIKGDGKEWEGKRRTVCLKKASARRRDAGRHHLWMACNVEVQPENEPKIAFKLAKR